MERVRFHPGTGHIPLPIRLILSILSKKAVFDRINRMDRMFSPPAKTIDKIASRFYRGGSAAIGQKDFKRFPLCLEFEFSVIEICLGFGAWNLSFLTLLPSYPLTF
jgi:hypothetical protein